MAAESQWVPLGEEDLRRVGVVLKRVSALVVLTLLVAIVATTAFFRNDIDLSASASYDPATAVHRTYDGATDVRCGVAQGGWSCSYRVDDRRCQTAVFQGQRVVVTADCIRR